MPGLAEEAKFLLGNLEASARKKLGQNFMVDERVLEFIANALDFQEEEPVIEIGPGLGFLTRFLLSHGATVTAIEKDPAFAGFLTPFFKYKKFKVVEADVLKTKISDIITTPEIKVCGNIPYNITSPILEWLIEQKKFVSIAVLTVQWEVAERLRAQPGNKTWGSLSVFLQHHAKVEVIKKISPSSFSPAPKVDSAVIKLTFLKKPLYEVGDEVVFFSLVRRAFQKRRKTLLNALFDENNPDFSKPSLLLKFSQAGIDPLSRAEILTLQKWADLSRLFKK